MLALFGEVGVADGGEDGLVSEYLLDFDQVDAGFYQVGSIAVAQAVWCNSFFKRQSRQT